jgi:outer membrane lipoprotein-sorting protein
MGRPRSLRLAVWLMAALLGLSGALGTGSAQAAEPPMDAATLMRRMDELYRGDSSKARMTMTVKTRHYERTMSLLAWSEGKDKSLVRILAPKKDAGIATLRVDRNIWNYLPKINRVTKVPPSMMMGSWMGSHFTNDDLVKESSFEDDYTSTITFQGQRDGHVLYEVTSIPRPDAPVVWGKVVSEIDQRTLLPLKTSYFDEDGKEERVMRFDAPRTFDKRLLPSRLVMVPTDKPEESTTISYEELSFNVALAPDLFSLRSLRAE